MDAFTAEDRLLQRSHRARLRDQLSAWGRVAEPPTSSATNSPAIKPPALSGHDANGWSCTSDERIPPRELSRKLWHILPGYLILGVPVVRSFEPFHSHLCLVIVAFTVVLSALSLICDRRFTRPGERDWQMSVCAFAATGLLPLLAFPGHCELALTALVILSLGDGARGIGRTIAARTDAPMEFQKDRGGNAVFLRLCRASRGVGLLGEHRFWRDVAGSADLRARCQCCSGRS